METLKDPEPDDNNVDHTTPIVTTILQRELKSVMETLAIQDSVMQAQIDHCRQQSVELDTMIQQSQKLHTKLQEQYDKMEANLKYMHRKSNECFSFLDEIKTSFTRQLRVIEEKYKNSSSSSMSYQQTIDAMDQLASKFKRRINRMKETT